MDGHRNLPRLGTDERVIVEAPAREALMVVTDHRVTVVNEERVLLDVPIEGLRRIQFDIERRRPATMVIVPEDARYEPQVLAIEAAGYDAAGRALAAVGLHFAGAGHDGSDWRSDGAGAAPSPPPGPS